MELHGGTAVHDEEDARELLKTDLQEAGAIVTSAASVAKLLARSKLPSALR